jgi:hypothetical protein
VTWCPSRNRANDAQQERPARRTRRIDHDLPKANAEALIILNNAHPSATAEQLAAIRGAIATWDQVLRDCFDGLITLTDVTGAKRKTADIVVHYVPTAGGVVFGGYAICGANRCPNILVRSDLPPSLDREPYDPEYLVWVTLHELGHALGLGHATNLLESTDLMGYGWPDLGDPVLSDCDRTRSRSCSPGPWKAPSPTRPL